MPDLQQLEDRIKELYNAFFEKHGIDTKNGLIADQKYRFATMPFIGENYPEAKPKILFVGMDMGMDETNKGWTDIREGYIQSFDERRKSICTPVRKLNPHMSGTYVTAMYFLKEDYGWCDIYDQIEKSTTHFKSTLINLQNNLPEDVLKNVSLTNYGKFVNAGEGSRKSMMELADVELLKDEIDILQPDIIVLQGKKLHWLADRLKASGRVIYRGYHPSVIGRAIKYRIPANYIENLKRDATRNDDLHEKQLKSM
jgi:hypothetical protein